MPGLADAEDMRTFLGETGADTFRHLDDAADIWDRFGVTRQSSYVFINNDGTWRVGEYGSLVEDVEGLIAQ